MRRPPVIGISGLARSGKDTAAHFIIAAVGGYKFSFADPIRQMLIPLGIDLSDPYWQARKEEKIPALGVSPRRLMQTLGTEWGREMINPNLWLIGAQQRLITMGPGMVIPDVRFENEADWVRRMGGQILHIKRDNGPKVEAHSSENGVTLRDEDLYVANNGTLEQLQAAIQRLFNVFDQA